MDVSTFDRLLTPEGESALAAAEGLTPTETNFPACVDRLSRLYPNDLVRAALDTVMLRGKAKAKFSHAHRMFFTREALEVATSELVATHRARRFANFTTVADLCCGIGADSTAMAGAGCAVTSIDRDPLRLRMAEVNMKVNGGIGRFLLADVLDDPIPVADAVFADPGRRPGDRRVLALRSYEPPVQELLARLPGATPVGVKVAPGVPRSDIEHLDAEAEFVSLHGELKECVLWFGPLKSATVRATVLPGGHTLTGVRREQPIQVCPVKQYLLDPDPAATRSGLLDVLAESIGAYRIDSVGVLLTTDKPAATPFATPYVVEDVLPFRVPKLADWLRVRGVGRVTLIRRGPAANCDAIQRGLKLRGPGHRCVFVTFAQGRQVAIIGDRVGE